MRHDYIRHVEAFAKFLAARPTLQPATTSTALACSRSRRRAATKDEYSGQRSKGGRLPGSPRGQNFFAKAKTTSQNFVVFVANTLSRALSFIKAACAGIS
jgi:hypothetical protein